MKNKPKIDDKQKAICGIIYMFGIVYFVFTFIHFGIQFYDLDRWISNSVIGFLIIGFGWVVRQFYKSVAENKEEQDKTKKEVKELRTDVKAINKLCNDILNKK